MKPSEGGNAECLKGWMVECREQGPGIHTAAKCSIVSLPDNSMQQTALCVAADA